jgi:hypothetical protein
MVIYLDFYSAGKNFSSFAAFEKKFNEDKQKPGGNFVNNICIILLNTRARLGHPHSINIFKF